MNRPRPFDHQLEAFLDEGPAGAPVDLLDEVLGAVHSTTRRRRPGAQRRLLMLSSLTRFAAAVAAVLVVGVVGIAVLNSRSPGVGGTGATASPATPATTASASASMSAAATPTLSPTAGGPALCSPATLSARIVSWDGAAGHRIATVELRNTGAESCITRPVDRPQLVGGDGTVLIEGVNPASSTDVLTLAANGKVTTLVQDGNYCGSTPVAPVTVAFVLSTGAGRVLATPLTPTDVSGIPPCNSAPGTAGTVEMQPWAQ